NHQRAGPVAPAVGHGQAALAALHRLLAAVGGPQADADDAAGPIDLGERPARPQVGVGVVDAAGQGQRGQALDGQAEGGGQVEATAGGELAGVAPGPGGPTFVSVRLAVPVAAGQPVVATVNVPGRVVPGRSAVAEAGLRPLAAAAEDRPVFAEGALVVAPADRA